jgi:hypothetical protein
MAHGSKLLFYKFKNNLLALLDIYICITFFPSPDSNAESSHDYNHYHPNDGNGNQKLNECKTAPVHI